MASYYFTLASLPSPESAAQLPTPERFLEMAATELDTKALEVLQQIFENQHTDDPFVQSYRSFDLRLRYELARLRAQSLSWPVSEPEEMSDEYLAESARQVFQRETPLEAEEALDELRQVWLVRAAFGKDYRWEHLLSYALRLVLWWKKKHREVNRGRDHFETNYQKITQNRGVKAP